MLYVPDGQALQFTPSQLAGGSSWTPVGKLCQVVFHPPTPVKPALHMQAACVPCVVERVLEFGGQAYLTPQNPHEKSPTGIPMQP